MYNLSLQTVEIFKKHAKVRLFNAINTCLFKKHGAHPNGVALQKHLWTTKFLNAMYVERIEYIKGN